MDIAEITVISINLMAGFGFAIPMARLLSEVRERPPDVFRYYVFFIGIYFFECVAIVSGMLIPVFSMLLAFFWGMIFGLWLRTQTPARKVLKTSIALSLYSSLPAVSFIVVPLIGLFAGKSILSSKEGFLFGIPEFLFWPLNTILGFYVALAVGVTVLKTGITTGIVSLLIRNRK